MGRREFFAWVDQAHRDNEAQQASAHSWKNAESDPGWQAMRDKRAKMRGR